MEDMTNRQIVLLTMLVSFVVSTATGIMTVAMLEEAPPTLTQTVNRVVERTIERVVTGTSTPEKPVPAPVTTITKEVTIFAKEDDLVVDAVEKNQPRIARIFAPDTATSSAPDAIGVVISRDGYVIADRTALPTLTGEKRSVTVQIGEKYYSATVLSEKDVADGNIALIRLNITEGESQNAISFGANIYPKIAQTLIFLGGVQGDAITRGTVSKLVMSKPVGTSTETRLIAIDVTPHIPDGYDGGLVVNLDGQAVGVVLKNADDKLIVYPSERILELVSAVTKKGGPTSATPAQSQTATAGTALPR